MDAIPTDDRVRAHLMLIGVPAHMLTRGALRNIVASSTGEDPDQGASADWLAREVITLAGQDRLKLPSSTGSNP